MLVSSTSKLLGRTRTPIYQATSAEWGKWIGVLALLDNGLLDDTSLIMPDNRNGVIVCSSLLMLRYL